MTDTSTIPRHVGYIVDGNRRWAKQHGIPKYESHLAGYNTLIDVAKESFDAGISFVSAYVFSTENWKRSQDEVKHLMGLVLKLLRTDIVLLEQHDIRLLIVGSRQGVDDKILKEIDAVEARTANNTHGTLVLCFNYGGHQEIVDAYKKIMQAGVSPDELTPDIFEHYLYHPEVPPVDLVVRTSGEQRISNFMLWRAAYSEFLFLEKHWPDMTKEDVAAILEEYSRRGRRFGG